jgi:hypothetical protein
VHCEQQVLRFVMSYLSTTAVEPHNAAAIWGEVSRLRQLHRQWCLLIRF